MPVPIPQAGQAAIPPATPIQQLKPKSSRDLLNETPEQEAERLRAAHERVALQRAQKQKEEEQAALRRIEEAKAADLARLEATLAAAAEKKAAGGDGQDDGEEGGRLRDKMKSFARKRSATLGGRGASPPHTSSGPAAPPGNAVELPINDLSPKKSAPNMRTPSNPPVPTAILAGGVGAGLDFDAPISAVNAATRRITVKCMQASISLPVDPSTSARKLIYSAANILSNSVAPDAAILYECYNKVGVERRVRRYERIRDILNSWDRDTAGWLELRASETGGRDKELVLEGAPRVRPQGRTVHLYHSNKRGKWTKQYCTVLSTGIVVLTKSKPTGPIRVHDKDTQQICHLSDYDVYYVTASSLKRDVRPPKKYCIAVKSQQKSTMFDKSDNFVHFFCADDRVAIEGWEDILQSWRSWHLVAEKRVHETAAPDDRTRAGKRGKPDAGKRDSVLYTLGTFEPLLGGADADPTRHAVNPENITELLSAPHEPHKRVVPFHLRHSVLLSPPGSATDSDNSSSRRRHPPPVALNKARKASPVTSPVEGSNDAAFTGGLLGRTYTVRKEKALKDAQADAGGGGNPDFQTGAFIAGGLLAAAGAPGVPSDARPKSSDGPRRALTTREPGRPTHARHPSTGRSRSASVARPSSSHHDSPFHTSGDAVPAVPRLPPGIPAPLLDLTPTFHEAPQWSKEGKGHGVAAPAGAPLIEAVRTALPAHEEKQLAMIDATTLFRREEVPRASGDFGRGSRDGGRPSGEVGRGSGEMQRARTLREREREGKVGRERAGTLRALEGR
jgi:hypothetical protein